LGWLRSFFLFSEACARPVVSLEEHVELRGRADQPRQKVFEEHRRRVRQQHVVSRLDQRRRGEVPLHPHRLDVALQAGAVPRRQQRAAVKGGHAPPQQQLVQRSLHREDERAAVAQSPCVQVPVEGELAVVPVSRGEKHRPAARREARRQRDQAGVLDVRAGPVRR